MPKIVWLKEKGKMLIGGLKRLSDEIMEVIFINARKRIRIKWKFKLNKLKCLIYLKSWLKFKLKKK
jgi:hypothetical protein